MKGRVEALCVFREKGKPGEYTERGIFTENLGMDGDLHARGGERQVTLCCAAALRRIKEEDRPGLCFKRYKANLTVDGLDVKALRPGMRLAAGTAVFEVSERGKACFPECSLFRSGRECGLAAGAVFLKVAQSGEVSEQDEIELLGGL
ncbi:MOSC domain-containing protein [Otoolea muris]|uniref:MOSC domain-containing protein n=1 Tax=Otoolea muris TaxID=2941515 RepID=UPI00203EC307|nr:MOSC domain-containing protein [Otoolea muris]